MLTLGFSESSIPPANTSFWAIVKILYRPSTIGVHQLFCCFCRMIVFPLFLLMNVCQAKPLTLCQVQLAVWHLTAGWADGSITVVLLLSWWKEVWTHSDRLEELDWNKTWLYFKKNEKLVMQYKTCRKYWRSHGRDNHREAQWGLGKAWRPKMI